MKNIYELLNDIDINDFEEAPVSVFEKEKIKHSLNEQLFSKRNKYNRKMKILKLSAASIVIFITSSIAIFSSPALANNIPIVNELIQRFYGNENIDFINYSDFIGQTTTKNGIELTFNNVVISDNSMFLDFNIKKDETNISKDDLNNSLMLPQKIKINGIDLPTNSNTSYDLIDDSTIRVLETIDMESGRYTPEGKLNVEIDIYEVFNLKDTFTFKFEYDKTNQDKESISKIIGTDVNLDDKKIIINKASASPLSCSIDFTTNLPNDGKNFGFVAIDNNNKSLSFEKSSSSFNMGSFYQNYLNSIFYVSNNNMKQVTFTPYTIDTENQIVSMNDKIIQPIDLNKKEEFKMNTTNDFGVLIKDLILDGDYLIVNYNYSILGAESSRFGISYTKLLLNNNEFTINPCDDDNCNNLYTKYKNDYYNTSIFKIDNEENLFIELQFNNNMKFFKDKSITLDLPN